jgi:acyl carrier protein
MSVSISDQVRATILQVLGSIAPEADSATLDPAVPFRDQLDLDSIDFLNFVIGVHEALGIDISETDYARLGTLDDAVAYVAASQAAR